MANRYCGICHGERGCKDCLKKDGAEYTGLTGFFADSVTKQRNAEKTDSAKQYYIADLGTTTLAFINTDACGNVCASYGCENPQRSISADVIGRVDAACHGAKDELRIQIKEALLKGFLFVLSKKAADGNVCFGIAGNTVMQHLLLDYPTESLSTAPFRPYRKETVCLNVRDMFSECPNWDKVRNAFPVSAEVVIPPCFSAFVGGDIFAGAYGLRLLNSESDEVSMLLDFGTNGEILLNAGGKIYVTATALGCAFEGGRFAYAADLFRLIAQGRKQKVIDTTGLLADPYFENGYEELTQEDIRSFQLAKAAIRAGIEILTKKAGCAIAAVERVYLAGSVGRFSGKELLFSTGILPKEFEKKTVTVGNACLGGMSLFLRENGGYYEKKQAAATEVNLAQEPDFENKYYSFMNFDE